MPNTIRILLPIFPDNLKDVYFKGLVSVADDHTVTIYITKYTADIHLISEKQLKWDNVIYGYCGNYLPKKVVERRFPNFLVIDQNTVLNINRLMLNGNKIDTKSSCILMLYDYDSIKDSQAICDTTDDYFMKLVHLIQDEHGLTNRTECSTVSSKLQWLTASMFLQHVYNYWILIDWLKCTIRRDKKVSILFRDYAHLFSFCP